MLSGLLTGYQASGETETADLQRMTCLAATAADPWARSLPLHFTASALVVHPETRRVLLRWHYKHQQWLQVGGHGDPGETDPLRIALREAAEETGLTDLRPWPDASLRHAVVCHVRASATEPQHEHADLRYILATRDPGAVIPENDVSPLRWLAVSEARGLVGGNNLRRTLDRAEALFGQPSAPSARPLPDGGHLRDSPLPIVAASHDPLRGQSLPGRRPVPARVLVLPPVTAHRHAERLPRTPDWYDWNL